MSLKSKIRLIVKNSGPSLSLLLTGFGKIALLLDNVISLALHFLSA